MITAAAIIATLIGMACGMAAVALNRSLHRQGVPGFASSNLYCAVLLSIVLVNFGVLGFVLMRAA